jgi:hypothetical protein
MSDDKPKPVDDLKQGLNLLFRAAKGAVDALPTERLEGAVREGAKEVGKAFESVATEIDKVVTNVTTRGGSSPPAHNPQPPAATAAEAEAEAKKNEQPPQHYDDAYAPEPPAPGKGPRVG